MVTKGNKAIAGKYSVMNSWLAGVAVKRTVWFNASEQKNHPGDHRVQIQYPGLGLTRTVRLLSRRTFHDRQRCDFARAARRIPYTVPCERAAGQPFSFWRHIARVVVWLLFLT